MDLYNLFFPEHYSNETVIKKEEWDADTEY